MHCCHKYNSGWLFRMHSTVDDGTSLGKFWLTFWERNSLLMIGEVLGKFWLTVYNAFHCWWWDTFGEILIDFLRTQFTVDDGRSFGEILIDCLERNSLLMMGQVWGRLKLNESGRREVEKSSQQAQHAKRYVQYTHHVCILTYSSLRERESFMTLEGGGGL